MTFIFFKVEYKKYLKKIKKRDSRINNYSRKFLIPRFFTCLPIILLVPIFLFLKKIPNKTVGYNLSKFQSEYLKKNFENPLILNKPKKILDFNYGTLVFLFLNCFCHYFPLFPKIILFRNSKVKQVFVNSDFGFDQYNLVNLCKGLNIKTNCIQHGLFPIDNMNDLDGLDCCENTVFSETQKKVLEEAGFKGKIFVDKNTLPLFEKGNKEKWAKQGKSVIFIGPGFSHNEALKQALLELLNDLNLLLKKNYNFIYRPHPRDEKFHLELLKNKIKVDSSKKSSLNNEANLIFLGVKSTMLLQAQLSGRCAINIIHEKFPNYFYPDEINISIKGQNLNELDKIISKTAYR